MKKQMVERCIYECGDLLDISDVQIEKRRNSKKAPGFNSSKKAIVLSVTKNKDETFNYAILCDNYKIYTLKAEEQGKEKYLEHFDFNGFFEKGEID